jgi:hypothetical protein
LSVAEPRGAAPASGLLDAVEERARALFREARLGSGGQGDEAALARSLRDELETAAELVAAGGGAGRRAEQISAGTDGAGALARGDLAAWGTLLGWIFTHALGKARAAAGFAQISRSWLDDWRLARILADTLRELGLDDSATARAVALVEILVTHQSCFEMETGRPPQAFSVLSLWLTDAEVEDFLQVNRHRGILWFNKEAFEAWLSWTALVAEIADAAAGPPADAAARRAERQRLAVHLTRAAEQSGYQLERLVELARSS